MIISTFGVHELANPESACTKQIDKLLQHSLAMHTTIRHVERAMIYMYTSLLVGNPRAILV